MKYPECYKEMTDDLDSVLEGPLEYQRTDIFFRRMAEVQRKFLAMQMAIVENMQARIAELEEQLSREGEL